MDDDDPDGGAGKTKSDEPCISKSADDDDDDDGTTCPICFDPWTSSGEHRVMFPDWRNFWALYDFKGPIPPSKKQTINVSKTESFQHFGRTRTNVKLLTTVKH